MRGLLYTSAPEFSTECVQPPWSGFARKPYPGPAVASPAIMLKVTRTTFGAYGSIMIVCPYKTRGGGLASDHAQSATHHVRCVRLNHDCLPIALERSCLPKRSGGDTQ